MLRGLGASRVQNIMPAVHNCVQPAVSRHIRILYRSAEADLETAKFAQTAPTLPTDVSPRSVARWQVGGLVQNSQGEIRFRSVVPKSLMLRVASRPPLTAAIAAIMPSGADMPRPAIAASPMIRP